MRSHSRSDRSRSRRLRLHLSGRCEARCDCLWSHGSRYQSHDRRRFHDRSPSSDRLQSKKRSWRPGRSRRDREEAVVASCDRSNSRSTVEPAPAVAGGSIPLPTSSFTDVVRLFLSLSGPVAQRGCGCRVFVVGCWCHQCWGAAWPR